MVRRVKFVVKLFASAEREALWKSWGEPDALTSFACSESRRADLASLSRVQPCTPTRNEGGFWQQGSRKFSKKCLLLKATTLPNPTGKLE